MLEIPRMLAGGPFCVGQIKFGAELSQGNPPTGGILGD